MVHSDAVLYWVVFSAAMIHVVEEYFFGWVEWANGYVKGVDPKQFVVFNLLFLILCLLGALNTRPLLRLALLSLFFVNALIHIGASIREKRYTPGLVSAAGLYVPIAVYGLIHYFVSHNLLIWQYAFGILFGMFIMAIPFTFQALRGGHKSDQE